MSKQLVYENIKKIFINLKKWIETFLGSLKLNIIVSICQKIKKFLEFIADG